MKRSQLKNIANKTGKDIDLYKFRKQRNLVNLNEKEKNNFLNCSLIENGSKSFWEMDWFLYGNGLRHERVK